MCVHFWAPALCDITKSTGTSPRFVAKTIMDFWMLFHALPLSRCGFCKDGRACSRTDGACDDCEPGYNGTQCNLQCLAGYYGDGCREKCPRCRNNEPCDHKTGKCSRCDPGWTGLRCVFEAARINTNNQFISRDFNHLMLLYQVGCAEMKSQMSQTLRRKKIRFDDRA